MMKALFLAAFVGLLHAEVVVKHLRVHEGATDYTQTVTLDFDRNIQILEVPAHNNIVHSKTIFDFNQVRPLFLSNPIILLLRGSCLNLILRATLAS